MNKVNRVPVQELDSATLCAEDYIDTKVTLHYEYVIARLSEGYLVINRIPGATVFDLGRAKFCKDKKQISEYFLQQGLKDRMGVQGELDLAGGTTATVYP